MIGWASRLPSYGSNGGPSLSLGGGLSRSTSPSTPENPRFPMANSNDPDIGAATARAEAQSEMHGTESIPPLQADRHSNLDPAVETPVEARQGFLGFPVLAVLIGGLLLAGIGWFAVHYAVQ